MEKLTVQSFLQVVMKMLGWHGARVQIFDYLCADNKN